MSFYPQTKRLSNSVIALEGQRRIYTVCGTNPADPGDSGPDSCQTGIPHQKINPKPNKHPKTLDYFYLNELLRIFFKAGM